MKVIVAVDLTEAADQIVKSITKRCWQPDTEFKLLTVIEPIKHDSVPENTTNCPMVQMASKRHEIAMLRLSKLRKTLQEGVSNSHVHTDIRVGSALEEIVIATGEWMADMLVAGAHGPAPNRLLGSTPRRLVEETSCKVELIRLKALPTNTYR